ncbi:zinc ABC transporter substrate-binding protein [bacterium]|nr:zinc ABC transporter substrate-binding protein [bacterium]
MKSFDGQEPSAQQIATLISTLKSNNVKIIFTEPQFSPDILTIIAEEVD